MEFDIKQFRNLNASQEDRAALGVTWRNVMLLFIRETGEYYYYAAARRDPRSSYHAISEDPLSRALFRKLSTLGKAVTLREDGSREVLGDVDLYIGATDDDKMAGLASFLIRVGIDAHSDQKHVVHRIPLLPAEIQQAVLGALPALIAHAKEALEKKRLAKEEAERIRLAQEEEDRQRVRASVEAAMSAAERLFALYPATDC